MKEQTTATGAVERGSTTWTPGPWRVMPHTNERPSRATVCADVGADIYDAPLTGETAANARLIAAAADLYAALERAIEFRWAADIAGERSAFAAEPAREQARAALAKARGEAVPA